MRYTKADQTTRNMLSNIINNRFDEYKNLNIDVIFDSKKRIKDGKFVVAQIKKANDLVKFLVDDDVHYLIFLDENVWNVLDPSDQVRVLTHELRHISLETKNEELKYNIKPHDFETFKAEIEDENKPGGDPLYSERILLIAKSFYDNKD